MKCEVKSSLVTPLLIAIPTGEKSRVWTLSLGKQIFYSLNILVLLYHGQNTKQAELKWKKLTLWHDITIKNKKKQLGTGQLKLLGPLIAWSILHYIFNNPSVLPSSHWVTCILKCVKHFLLQKLSKIVPKIYDLHILVRIYTFYKKKMKRLRWNQKLGI